MLALFAPLLVASMPLVAPPAWFAPSMLPAKQIRDTMRQISAQPTAILIDGNNVRGRVNFRLSKLQLSSLVTAWAEEHKLHAYVCWDHGATSTALVWGGCCHAFAGPRRSADDVIADAVRTLLSVKVILTAVFFHVSRYSFTLLLSRVHFSFALPSPSGGYT